MNVQRCLEILREVRMLRLPQLMKRDFLKFVLLM